MALARALEDQAPAPVAQAAHVLDFPAQILVEGQLEAVLAETVGCHEPEDGPGELAAGVVPVTLSLDRQAADGV